MRKTFLVKFVWLVPMVIITTYLLVRAFKTNGCIGLVEFIGSMFWLALLGLSLIILVVVQVVSIVDRRNSKQALVIIFSGLLIFILAIKILLLPHGYFRGKEILVAEFIDQGKGELTLFEDMTYSAAQYYIEWTCYFDGNYLIKNDTLFLEQDLVLETDSLFNPIYLMQGNNYLIPVNLIAESDTSNWLQIKE